MDWRWNAIEIYCCVLGQWLNPVGFAKGHEGGDH